MHKYILLIFSSKGWTFRPVNMAIMNNTAVSIHVQKSLDTCCQFQSYFNYTFVLVIDVLFPYAHLCSYFLS